MKLTFCSIHVPESVQRINRCKRYSWALFLLIFCLIILWSFLEIRNEKAAYSQQINWLQVNICQKLLFLYQLTHNMMTDCSLFIKIVTSEYLQNMLCTQLVVFGLFGYSEQFWCTTCSADVVSFWKRFTCTNSMLHAVSDYKKRWSEKIVNF